MLTKTLKHTIAAWTEGENFVIYTGDCHELLKVLPDACVTLTLTSPPYFMGKSYDKSTKLSDFQAEISKLAPSLVRLSKDNGSICWQVGYHAKNGEVYPLDYAIFEAFRTSRIWF